VAAASTAPVAPEPPDGESRAAVRSAAVAGRPVVVCTTTPARVWVCAAGPSTFPTGLWPRRSSTASAAD